MKLLLDENFPQKVSLDFPEHSITTVQEAGWRGKKNGELLELMTGSGFEGFVTLDQNLPRQQNLAKFSVTIFLLKPVDSRPATVNALIPKLRMSLSASLNTQVVEIE